MLIINALQMKTLDDRVERQFKQELLTHVRTFFPLQAAHQSDESIYNTIAFATSKAQHWGCIDRRSICYVLNLVYAFGGFFNESPLYNFLPFPDGSSHQPAIVFDFFNKTALDHCMSTIGASSKILYFRLHRLLVLLEQPTTISAIADPSFASEEQLILLYPERMAGIEVTMIRSFLTRTISAAQSTGFNCQDARLKNLLIIIALFAGFRFYEDPVFIEHLSFNRKIHHFDMLYDVFRNYLLQIINKP